MFHSCAYFLTQVNGVFGHIVPKGVSQVVQAFLHCSDIVVTVVRKHERVGQRQGQGGHQTCKRRGGVERRVRVIGHGIVDVVVGVV